MRTLPYSAWVLLAALALAGCGGGGAAGPNTCSLTNPGGCGGSAQPDPAPGTAPPPDPASKAASVSLVFSNGELGSAGLAGDDVSVTALVKSSDNTAVSDAPISFSADSGFLAVSNLKTNSSGKASATLGTGGSRLNRPIKITARVGNQTATAVVQVVGTRLTMSGPAHVQLGESADLVATLVDSANRPIGGETITATVKNGNALSSTTGTSDSQGQVRLKLQASQRGDEQVSVTALGASAAKAITVTGSELVLLPSVTVGSGGIEVLAEVVVGSCSPVDGRYLASQTGSVTLTASRGSLYSDASCFQPLTGALAIANGSVPRTYIRSDNAGVSTVDAVVSGGPAAATRIEFVAPMAASSKINLQTDLAVVGSGERSNLIAVVRDGTSANNLVKGALVQFSIVADPSGGNLVSPFTAVTGSDGIARGVFVAGPGDGGKDGTILQARLAAMPSAFASTVLTVNRKALSIQFGTGNLLTEFSSSVLQKDFAVFVSDSAGNPVKDVAITASAWPVMFAKGVHEWEQHNPPLIEPGNWVAKPTVFCDNEDLARRGLYEAAFDRNGNGTLEPGIPISVVSGGKTDAFGMTTVSLRYPRDRANWVKVELTVSGTVAGTESRARNAFWLSGGGERRRPLRHQPSRQGESVWRGRFLQQPLLGISRGVLTLCCHKARKCATLGHPVVRDDPTNAQ